ncbi:hypothetical protein [Nonomuraea wenchangensis]|uniref:hypothetical protein n=1 Tax=Nonomuraea wenchangensis TaxID=568860 RepID=UPI00332A538C
MAREVSFPQMSEEQMRVHRAGEALHRDGASPAGALDLLAAIVADRTWERLADAKGRSFKGRFREFVEAKSPYGLGYDPDQLPKVLQLRHPHESVPEIAYRMAEMREQVKRLLLEEIPPVAPAVHAGPGRGHKTHDATNGFRSNSADYVTARLKRDDPELAEKVVRGEVTPNAAAREKGWRKPRIVVTTPEKVAAALRKIMPTEARRVLARLLLDEE